MWKLIKVINNKDRYFNGARKGQIIQVDETRLNYYIQNGFSLVREVEEKKNIVTTPTTPTTPVRTKKELYIILDHLWVEYDKNLKVAELEALVREVEEKQKTADETKTTDIEAIKKQLVDDAIVEVTELEWKTDAEILQIATDNWLI